MKVKQYDSHITVELEGVVWVIDLLTNSVVIEDTNNANYSGLAISPKSELFPEDGVVEITLVSSQGQLLLAVLHYEKMMITYDVWHKNGIYSNIPTLKQAQELWNSVL